MDKETLNLIKKKLPHDYIDELTIRSKKSKSTVGKTMNGDRECLAVIDAAIAWGCELELERKNRNKKIEELCSQPD